MEEELYMVKTVMTYKCEICNWSYDNFEDAKNCEGRVFDEPLAKVGDIVDYFQKGIEGWDSIDTFLDDLVIMEIRKNRYNPHHLEYVLGWESDSGKLIEDVHADVNSNYDFEERCTIKTQ